MIDKLDMLSTDGVAQNIQKIAQLFPHCVTETTNGLAIDFDLLKQELSTDVIDGIKERYRLEWPGKREAIVTANLPTANTLRPEPEESVDFDHTQNLYIEGDNLEVLKLLQESYLGKIKMIYIDPPYNTGKDFVYKDNFTQDSAEYQTQAGLRDDQNNRLVANPDTSGRYHSDWLSMMYPRLKLARNLLTDDGVIFISIDDNEVHNLRKICDEIFGEDNFVGQFIVNSTPNARDYGHIGKMHEFVLFYSKNFLFTDTMELIEEEKTFKYSDKISGFNIHPLYNSNESFNSSNRPNLYYPFYLNPNNSILNDFYEISIEKKENWIEIYPPKSEKNNIQFVWRWGKQKSFENLNIEILGYKTNNDEYRIVQKMRHSSKIIRSLLIDKNLTSRRGTSEMEELFEKKVFDFPKPVGLIYNFVNITLRSEDLVLDFFSGSATTAHAVMQLNAEDGGKRRYIMVQLPEQLQPGTEAHKAGYATICDIGKERIRRAAQKIKADKVEKAKKEGLFAHNYVDNQDYGFRVFKLDTSNMEDVFYKPKDIDQDQLNLFADNLKPDRTAQDLVTQIMLDWGLPLSLPITKTTIAGKEVFKVNDDALFACFDDQIDETFAKEVATYKPLRIVFRDRSFRDDTAKENVKQLLHQLAPDTEMKVL